MDMLEAARLIEAVGGADMELVRETRAARLWDLAELWARERAVTGLEPSTMKEYLLSIELAGRFGIRTVADVTPSSLRSFMKAFILGGRSSETANRKLAAVSSLMKWLWAEGRVPWAHYHELRGLYFERGHVPPIEHLSASRYVELRTIARAIDATRFELLVAFGVESGLRWHEARQLHREDLELEMDAPFLRVSHTHGRKNKTKRERTVPIRVAFAQELLARELAAGPLFPARAREGEELLSPYLHRSTYREWRRASLERSAWWNWHLLRHTFASWNVQRSRTLSEVSEWLGCSERVARRHYARFAPGGDARVEQAFVDVPGFAPPAAKPAA